MGRYLDPKDNTVFKSIFGEHPELLVSLLNAILPLEEGQSVTNLKYLPDIDNFAEEEGLIEALCKDNHGDKFIVEMDMEQEAPYPDRMVYITANAYVRHCSNIPLYDFPKTVYSVAITNSIFKEEFAEYYNHYTLTGEKSKIVMRGMDHVIIELPKFTDTLVTENKMLTLWLRFFKEINANCDIEPAPKLIENEYIRKAIELCEVVSK
jgi:hypothetical protein